MTDDCVFCDLTQFRAAEVCIENAFCLYASTRDPREPPDALPGCGVIIPIAHRPSPFDFTAEECAATHELLVKAKAALSEGAPMISIQGMSTSDWFGHKTVRMALDNFSMAPFDRPVGHLTSPLANTCSIRSGWLNWVGYGL
jgi:hypothetical protein